MKSKHAAYIGAFIGIVGIIITIGAIVVMNFINSLRY